ncbi:hypothetical protein [Brevibacillus reuszeri]|uniref:hypothetical protein n=1 Tax=Brevibacillus reuszeri TaxID=54915 RepID=UPI000CCC7791|nr:hypothetical protein [Brevibacillus reuszeri]
MKKRAASKVSESIDLRISQLAPLPSASFGTILRIGIQEPQIMEDRRGHAYWGLDGEGFLIREKSL